MAKPRKQKKYGLDKIDSHASKSARVEEFKNNYKEQKEAELLADERVAKKVSELEEQINESKVEQEKKLEELEKEFRDKKAALEGDIEEKKKSLELREVELAKQKEIQEQKEKELLESEKRVKEQCEVAVLKEIERIKADERNIREKEKNELYSTWEADFAQKKEELAVYISSQRKKVDSELELAHSERMEAQEQKMAKMREAHTAIEQERQALTKEYEEKIKELASKKKECEHKLLELKEWEADLEEEAETVKELRKKFNNYSEEKVITLEQELDHYKIQIQCYCEQIKNLSGKTAHMESILLDDEGQSMSSRIRELEEQLKDAIRRNDELVNLPSEEEIERLRANTKELEALRLVLDEEKQKRHEAEDKISAYAMSNRELENARVASAALESLNNQLQMKLKYISDQYKSTQEQKFKVLTEIDNAIGTQGIYNPKGFNGSLKELCEYVRNYGAYQEGLYYSIDTIRVFFASLAASEKASRLLILQGLSGTGKSSLPRLVAKALDVECKLVPVQPSWRDNRELLGYDNDFTNRFKETEFTKFLYEASAMPNRQKIYLIVLDEMNLARIEYYFADFLSVLEKPDTKDWIVPLVSGYVEQVEENKPKYLNYDNEAANICITENIWFVGTANNDDSTSLITDKVYDRAQVLDMDEREDEFKGERVSKRTIGLDELLQLFQSAKEKKNELNNTDKENIGLVDGLLKQMDITFGNRIMNQMDDFVPVYIACGGTKEGAIDYILTHKILRKLDERYEPYLLTKLDELEKGLMDIYGEGKFKQSVEKIHKLKEKIAG